MSKLLKNTGIIKLMTIIKTALKNKADVNHTHDDRYYTESEIDTKMNSKANSSHTHSYLPLSGGTMNDFSKLTFNQNNGFNFSDAIDIDMRYYGFAFDVKDSIEMFSRITMHGGGIACSNYSYDNGFHAIYIGDGCLLVGTLNTDDGNYVSSADQLPDINKTYQWRNENIRDKMLLKTEICSNSINNTSSSTFFIYTYNKSSSNMLSLGFNAVDKRVFPGTNSYATMNSIDLGGTSNRWNNIYATNGTIQTSDRNEKNTINDLDIIKILSFIQGLKPVSYKFNNGTSDRTHYGFIAQDVEDLMKELGMDSKDFAGFIKSPNETYGQEYLEEDDYDENGKIIKKQIPNPNKDREFFYSLRYDEFIAPMMKTIQYLCKVVEEQGQEIQSLKAQLS